MVEEDNRQADSTNVMNGKFIFKRELLQSCWAAVRIDGMDAFKKLGSLNVETERKKELYAITREKVIK